MAVSDEFGLEGILFVRRVFDPLSGWLGAWAVNQLRSRTDEIRVLALGILSFTYEGGLLIRMPTIRLPVSKQ